jgi:hypothetical protein
MTEFVTPRETNSAIVSNWIDVLDKSQKVGEIEIVILRKALQECGANFELSEAERASLRNYTEGGKLKGIEAVWGDSYKTYKSWVEEYIKGYEFGGFNVLPALEPSGRKNSGLIQFFGELTSMASGVMDLETYRKYTEARAFNGKMWLEGKKELRKRIQVPTSETPIRLSSFPPGFVRVAWLKIQSFK